MKIERVEANNRRKAFEVETDQGERFFFPYARLRLRPSESNKIVRVYPDPELGSEAFTGDYCLAAP